MSKTIDEGYGLRIGAYILGRRHNLKFQVTKGMTDGVQTAVDFIILDTDIKLRNKKVLFFSGDMLDPNPTFVTQDSAGSTPIIAISHGTTYFENEDEKPSEEVEEPIEASGEEMHEMVENIDVEENDFEDEEKGIYSDDVYYDEFFGLIDSGDNKDEVVLYDGIEGNDEESDFVVTDESIKAEINSDESSEPVEDNNEIIVDENAEPPEYMEGENEFQHGQELQINQDGGMVIQGMPEYQKPDWSIYTQIPIFEDQELIAQYYQELFGILKMCIADTTITDMKPEFPVIHSDTTFETNTYNKEEIFRCRKVWFNLDITYGITDDEITYIGALLTINQEQSPDIGNINVELKHGKTYEDGEETVYDFHCSCHTEKAVNYISSGDFVRALYKFVKEENDKLETPFEIPFPSDNEDI